MRRRLIDAAINNAIWLIATLFLLFGTGRWESKENVSDHKADMQQLNAKLDRAIDVLCELAPNARQCNEKP